MIPFKESSLYKLMHEALLHYVQRFDTTLSSDEFELLDSVRNSDIPYVSEWFNTKGFEWLDEMEAYFFEENKHYYDFVIFQQFVWILNEDTDDLIHLFATFTHCMNNVIKFARAYGMKVQLNITMPLPIHHELASVTNFHVSSYAEASAQRMNPWSPKLVKEGLVAA